MVSMKKNIPRTQLYAVEHAKEFASKYLILYPHTIRTPEKMAEFKKWHPWIETDDEVLAIKYQDEVAMNIATARDLEQWASQNKSCPEIAKVIRGMPADWKKIVERRIQATQDTKPQGD